MNVLDLFSGIGGFSLGLERAGMRTVAFCEIDPFCRAVLRKHWPDVPIYEDVRTLDADRLGRIDLVCGGFPCQPFSSAPRGRKKGVQDHGYLWPAMCQIIEDSRPAWVIGENVDELANLALDKIISDLEARGYSVWAAIIPALAIGAPHYRERLWFVGHADREGQSNQSLYAETSSGLPELGAPFEWPPYTEGMGVGNGIPCRMDRLKALGNAVVPQIPEIIGRAILAAEKEMT